MTTKLHSEIATDKSRSMISIKRKGSTTSKVTTAESAAWTGQVDSWQVAPEMALLPPGTLVQELSIDTGLIVNKYVG